MTSKDFEKLERQLDRKISDAEREIINQYQLSLKEIKSILSDTFEQYDNPTLEDMKKYDRISKLEKSIAAAIATLYVVNRKYINNTLTSTYEGSYLAINTLINKESTKTIAPILKPLTTKNVVNTEMAGLKWTDRLRKREADLIYTIDATIKQGLQKGDTYATIAKSLDSKMVEVSKGAIRGDARNALTIVRTEATRVHSVAQTDMLDDARKQGVRMTKTWNSVEDERVRSSHVAMNGQTVDYDDMFTLPTGEKVVAPHQTGIDSEDINCRCFLSVALKED